MQCGLARPQAERARLYLPVASHICSPRSCVLGKVALVDRLLVPRQEHTEICEEALSYLVHDSTRVRPPNLRNLDVGTVPTLADVPIHRTCK